MARCRPAPGHRTASVWSGRQQPKLVSDHRGFDFLRTTSMRTRLLSLFAGLILLVAGGRAEAGYQFQFATASGTAQNTFVVDQGSTIDIRVYLVQTSPDTGLSASGLDAAGTKLTFNQTIANVSGTGAITASPAFDTSIKSTATGSATLNVSQDSGSAAVTAPTTGADANRILIGTFTFTGVSAGTTNVVTV